MNTECLEVCAHNWILNVSGYGVCNRCGAGRQFQNFWDGDDRFDEEDNFIQFKSLDIVESSWDNIVKAYENNRFN